MGRRSEKTGKSEVVISLSPSIPVLTCANVNDGDKDVELIIICAIIGCIPAAIASSKGRSFLLGGYTEHFFIVALIHSLVIKKDIRALEQSQLDSGLVKCPYCAEMIKPEARKCKHCGSDVKEAIEVARLKNFKPSDIPFDAFSSGKG